MKSIHITNEQNYNMSSGTILHKHRTKREDSPRWYVILGIAMVASSFAIRILTSSNARASELSLSVNNTSTVLEITVPSSVTLSVAPTSDQAFGTANLNIGVGTNNPSGYSLLMTASSDTLTRSLPIVDGNNNVTTPTILPMLTTDSANGYTAEQFASPTTNTYTLNRWGYKLSSEANYMPVTTSETNLKTTNVASNGTSTDVVLNFAVKVNSAQPAGIYTGTISFSAVTNIATTYVSTLAELISAYTAASNGDIITLSADIDGNGNELYFEKEITIDGNGHHISNLAVNSDGYMEIAGSGIPCDTMYTLAKSVLSVLASQYFAPAGYSGCYPQNASQLVRSVEVVPEGETISLKRVAGIDGTGVDLTVDRDIILDGVGSTLYYFDSFTVSNGTCRNVGLQGVGQITIMAGGFEGDEIIGTETANAVISGGNFLNSTITNATITSGNYANTNIYNSEIYGGTFGYGS